MKKLAGMSILLLMFTCALYSISVEKPAQAQQMFQSLNYATGLVGWWKLCGDTSATSGCNASTSTTVYDSSGNGNNGTWAGSQSGTTGWYSAGNVGPWAGAFNGSNNYVPANGAASLIQTGSVSITAWIYLPSTYNSASAAEIIVRCGDGASNNDVQLTLGKWHTGSGTADGMLHMSAYSGSAMVDSAGSKNSWTSGWYFVAGTYSSATGVTSYINGSQDGSSTAVTRGGTPYSTHFYIGANPNATNIFFSGLIDDVRVYNRALSAGEIAQMYLAHN